MCEGALGQLSTLASGPIPTLVLSYWPCTYIGIGHNARILQICMRILSYHIIHNLKQIHKNMSFYNHDCFKTITSIPSLYHCCNL